MRAKHRNRLLLVALGVIGVGGAVALMLVALSENINLFYSPTEVVQGKVPDGHAFRIGGLVAENSVRRSGEDDLRVNFDVTDGAHSVTVSYRGILPDLFREGQGIVAQGRLHEDGHFRADTVLAKHDENYMPPEVEAALRAAEEAGLPNPHSGSM